MEINTKLLITDGDIVVIGGVKKEEQANATSKVPVLGDLPVVGNLFKGQGKTDDLRELLIFISPKILKPSSLFSNLSRVYANEKPKS